MDIASCRHAEPYRRPAMRSKPLMAVQIICGMDQQLLVQLNDAIPQGLRALIQLSPSSVA